MINEKLKHILSGLKGKVLFNEELKKHTWLGVGGPAEVMFHPKNVEDLSYFIKNRPHDVSFFILGGGSNLLVRDGGIKGVVIKLDAPYFKKIEFKNGILTCGAGIHNTTLTKFLIQNEVGGLEFLCSIPGTVGGLIKTNAGCFSKSVSDVLLKAVVMNIKGDIEELTNDDFHFSYRHSDLKDGAIVLSVSLKTTHDDAQNIAKIIHEQKKYRMEHQPVKEKTAGSTFKNPLNGRAWELIKQSGCEKLSLNKAKVSDKHCNFLINTGSATADDIENLGNKIIQKVKEKTGKTLEWEIVRVGQKNEF